MDWFIVLREVCYYFLYIGDYIFEIEIIFAYINFIFYAYYRKKLNITQI